MSESREVSVERPLSQKVNEFLESVKQLQLGSMNIENIDDFIMEVAMLQVDRQGMLDQVQEERGKGDISQERLDSYYDTLKGYDERLNDIVVFYSQMKQLKGELSDLSELTGRISDALENEREK